MNGAPERLFATTEGDLYRWQRETLTDLLAFLDAHAPGSAELLPAVPWRVNVVGRSVVGDLGPFHTDPSGVRADRRAVIEAYAAALGSEVKTYELTGKTRHATTGRIGRREGTAQEPRTTLYIETDIWADDDTEA
jgi:hypothetical protein